MSETTAPKVVRPDPVETDDGVEQPVQQPTGPGNRQGGGEFPDPNTPPSDLVEYDPQRVPVNVYETEGAVVVIAPLPGVMADDITVDVDGDRVHINAAERTPAEKDYITHEWHYGPYERVVDLPDGFGGTAEATFANGQLALRIERGPTGANQTVAVVHKP